MGPNFIDYPLSEVFSSGNCSLCISLFLEESCFSQGCLRAFGREKDGSRGAICSMQLFYAVVLSSNL